MQKSENIHIKFVMIYTSWERVLYIYYNKLTVSADWSKFGEVDKKELLCCIDIL